MVDIRVPAWNKNPYITIEPDRSGRQCWRCVRWTQWWRRCYHYANPPTRNPCGRGSASPAGSCCLRSRSRSAGPVRRTVGRCWPRRRRWSRRNPSRCRDDLPVASHTTPRRLYIHGAQYTVHRRVSHFFFSENLRYSNLVCCIAAMFPPKQTCRLFSMSIEHRLDEMSYPGTNCINGCFRKFKLSWISEYCWTAKTTATLQWSSFQTMLFVCCIFA